MALGRALVLGAIAAVAVPAVLDEGPLGRAAHLGAVRVAALDVRLVVSLPILAGVALLGWLLLRAAGRGV